jgi:hypothetical protein
MDCIVNTEGATMTKPHCLCDQCKMTVLQCKERDNTSEQVLDELERTMRNLHDVEELSYPDLWNELLVQFKTLRQQEREQE